MYIQMMRVGVLIDTAEACYNTVKETWHCMIYVPDK